MKGFLEADFALSVVRCVGAGFSKGGKEREKDRTLKIRGQAFDIITTDILCISLGELSCYFETFWLSGGRLCDRLKVLVIGMFDYVGSTVK